MPRPPFAIKFRQPMQVWDASHRQMPPNGLSVMVNQIYAGTDIYDALRGGDAR